MRNFIEQIGNYRIYESNSGGKAGRGKNRTASIFVTQKNGNVYLDVKSYRYKVGAFGNIRAIIKAKKFIKNLIQSETRDSIQGN